MGSAYLNGLIVGLAFIVAIGPQNAFVLKNGLLRQNVFMISFICAASDAVLILGGIAGLDRARGGLADRHRRRMSPMQAPR